MAFRDIFTWYGQVDPVTHKFNPKSWAAQHHPGANVQATATRAADPKNKRHIATNITIILAAGASAPTAASVTAALLDGASGSTNYLWGPHDISIPSVAGSMNGVSIPVWIVGSPGTAMTLEFSGAAGLNTFESVTLNGVSI